MIKTDTSELIAEIADELDIAPHQAMSYADELLAEQVRDDDLLEANRMNLSPAAAQFRQN